MRYAFILSALLSLAGPAVAAPPAVKKCDSCENCKCADGFCPTRCAVTISVKAKGDLDAANAAVAKGDKVVLCIGVSAIDGAYACGSIKGYADGVYECFKFKKGEYADGLYDGLHVDGDLVMVPKAGSQASTYCVNGTCYSPGVVQRGIVQPTYGNLFQSSCPGGNCPATSTRRR